MIVSQVSVSEQVSLVSAVRYRWTRTRRHYESLIEGRVVYHGLQVGGTQSKFPLFAVCGVVFEVVLEIALLLGSAAHVAWTHASGSFDSATAVFAIMSGVPNFTTTTARTDCHALSDTPHTVASVECLCRSVQVSLILSEAKNTTLCF